MKDILQIFAFVVVGVCMTFAIAIGLKKFAEHPSPLERPTIYAVYGGEKPCEYAKNPQGEDISCTEAMKMGNYDIIPIAHESLRRAE